MHSKNLFLHWRLPLSVYFLSLSTPKTLHFYCFGLHCVFKCWFDLYGIRLSSCSLFSNILMLIKLQLTKRITPMSIRGNLNSRGFYLTLTKLLWKGNLLYNLIWFTISIIPISATSSDTIKCRGKSLFIPTYRLLSIIGIF